VTTDDIRAIAHRMVETLVRDYPVEAATIAALVLSELLEATLFADDDDAAISEFVHAVNSRLDEIALRRRAGTSWRLVRSDRPQRH
jgi:hypothetical protein